MGEGDVGVSNELEAKLLELQQTLEFAENEKQRLKKQYLAKSHELEREQRSVKRLEGQVQEMEILKSQIKRLRTFEEAAGEAEVLKQELQHLKAVLAQKNDTSSSLSDAIEAPMMSSIALAPLPSVHLAAQPAFSGLPSRRFSENSEEELDPLPDRDILSTQAKTHELTQKISAQQGGLDQETRSSLLETLKAMDSYFPAHIQAIQDKKALKSELQEIYSYILTPGFRPAPSVFSERELKHKQNKLEWEAKTRSMEAELCALKAQVQTLRESGGVGIATMDDAMQEPRSKLMDTEAERDAARQELEEMKQQLQDRLAGGKDGTEANIASERRESSSVSRDESSAASLPSRTPSSHAPRSASGSIAPPTTPDETTPTNKILATIQRFNERGIGGIQLDKIFEAYKVAGEGTGGPMTDSIAQDDPELAEVMSWMAQEKISFEDIKEHLARAGMEVGEQAQSSAGRIDIAYRGSELEDATGSSESPTIPSPKQINKISNTIKHFNEQGIGRMQLEEIFAVYAAQSNMPGALPAPPEGVEVSTKYGDVVSRLQDENVSPNEIKAYLLGLVTEGETVTDLLKSRSGKGGDGHETTMGLESSMGDAGTAHTRFTTPTSVSPEQSASLLSTVTATIQETCLPGDDGKTSMASDDVIGALHECCMGNMAALERLPGDVRGSTHFADVVSRLKDKGVLPPNVDDVLETLRQSDALEVEKGARAVAEAAQSYAELQQQLRDAGVPEQLLTAALKHYSCGPYAPDDQSELPDGVSHDLYSKVVAKLQNANLHPAAVGGLLSVTAAPPSAQHTAGPAQRFALALAGLRAQGVPEEQLAAVLQRLGVESGLPETQQQADVVPQEEYYEKFMEQLKLQGLQAADAGEILKLAEGLPRAKSTDAMQDKLKIIGEVLDSLQHSGIPDEHLPLFLSSFATGHLDDLPPDLRNSSQLRELHEKLESESLTPSMIADLLSVAQRVPRPVEGPSLADQVPVLKNMTALVATLEELQESGTPQHNLASVLSAYSTGTLDDIPEQIRSTQLVSQLTDKLAELGLTQDALAEVLALAKHISLPTPAPSVEDHIHRIADAVTHVREAGAPEALLGMILKQHASGSLKDIDALPAPLRSLPSLTNVVDELESRGLSSTATAELLSVLDSLQDSMEEDMRNLAGALESFHSSGIPGEHLAVVLDGYSKGSFDQIPEEIRDSPVVKEFTERLESGSLPPSLVADVLTVAKHIPQPTAGPSITEQSRSLSAVMDHFRSQGVPDNDLLKMLTAFSHDSLDKVPEEFLSSPYFPAMKAKLEAEALPRSAIAEMLAIAQHVPQHVDTPTVAEHMSSLAEVVGLVRHMGVPQANLGIVLKHYADGSLIDSDRLPSGVRALPNLVEFSAALESQGLSPAVVRDLLGIAGVLKDPVEKNVKNFADTLDAMCSSGIADEDLAAALTGFAIEGSEGLPGELRTLPQLKQLTECLELEGLTPTTIASILRIARHIPQPVAVPTVADHVTSIADAATQVRHMGVPQSHLGLALKHYAEDGLSDRASLPPELQSLPNLVEFSAALESQGLSPAILKDLLTIAGCVKDSTEKNVTSVAETLHTLHACGMPDDDIAAALTGIANGGVLSSEVQSSPLFKQLTETLEMEGFTPPAVSSLLSIARHIPRPVAVPTISDHVTSIAEAVSQIRQIGVPEAHLGVLLKHYAEGGLSDVSSLPPELQSLPNLEKFAAELESQRLSPAVTGQLLRLLETLKEMPSPEPETPVNASKMQFTAAVSDCQQAGIPTPILVSVLKHYSQGSAADPLPDEVTSSPNYATVLARLEPAGNLLATVADFMLESSDKSALRALPEDTVQLGKLLCSFHGMGIPPASLRAILECYAGQRDEDGVKQDPDTLLYFDTVRSHLDSEYVSPGMVEDLLSALEVLAPARHHVTPAQRDVTSPERDVTPFVDDLLGDASALIQRPSVDPDDAVLTPFDKLLRTLELVKAAGLDSKDIRNCIDTFLEAEYNGEYGAGRNSSTRSWERDTSSAFFSATPPDLDKLDEIARDLAMDLPSFVNPSLEPKPSATLDQLSTVMGRTTHLNQTLAVRMEKVRVKLSMLLMDKEAEEVEQSQAGLLVVFNDVAEQLGNIHMDVMKVADDNSTVMNELIARKLELARAAGYLSRMASMR